MPHAAAAGSRLMSPTSSAGSLWALSRLTPRIACNMHGRHQAVPLSMTGMEWWLAVLDYGKQRYGLSLKICLTSIARDDTQLCYLIRLSLFR